jgi:hypothetical protein
VAKQRVYKRIRNACGASQLLGYRHRRKSDVAARRAEQICTQFGSARCCDRWQHGDHAADARKRGAVQPAAQPLQQRFALAPTREQGGGIGVYFGSTFLWLPRLLLAL